MTTILGIDPGSHGALAVIGEDHDYIKTYHFENLTEQEIYKALLVEAFDGAYAYIEKVAGMPRDTGKTAFTFGRHYGFVRGCMVAIGIPFEEVYSQTWQKKLGIGGTYPTPYKRKQAQKQRAQQLFPKHKVIMDNADALLIAEYGYRVRNGM